MLSEVIEYLAPRPGGGVVDATVGLGGHAAAIMERTGPSGRLIGIDQDPAALAAAEQRLEAACREWGWSPPYPFSLHHASFQNLATVVRGIAGSPVQGILFDLGVSSMQLDQAE